MIISIGGGLLSGEKKKGNNKVIWAVISVLIAGASIWAVTQQSASFTLDSFWSYIKSSSPVFMSAAVLCVLSYVLFEGLAVLCIVKDLGYPRRLGQGITYSAADIYISAITPSASGGQPASAYFMMKDGIPAATTTVTLLLNLIMYTLSVIIIGFFAFVLHPSMFLNFDTLSKVLIIVGGIIQLGLAVLFWLILKKEQILYKFCMGVINILSKLKLMRRREKYEKKLEKIIAEYRECAAAVTGKKRAIIGSFIFNFLQRLSIIAVTMFVYLAAPGGIAEKAADVWALQSYVVIGSYCMPIPGAVGVSDYILLRGFELNGLASDPVSLELFCRSLSFYCCVLLCGIIVLVQYFVYKKRKG